MKVKRDLATHILNRHMERFEEMLMELEDYPKIRDQVFANLFSCSAIPQPGTNKVTLHLTMVLEAFVGEELPNIQTMVFHLLDFYWITESRSNEVSNKMLKLQAQSINEAILSHFFERYSCITQELTSASFWNVLSEYGDFRKIHPYQQVKIQSLLVDKKGVILEGNGQYLPTKADRAKLCRKFSEQLWIPDVREIFLRQFLTQKESVIPRSRGTKPMHIGWYQTDKAWEFSGIQATGGYSAQYGNALMRELPRSNPYGLSDLLAIAPYHVTVPLFCYGIFSVIKAFVPEYPARISQKQPFNQVIRHRTKMIFLSLNGRQASEIAQLFYGAFTDYGNGNAESKALMQLYQSRVHDGVVVYDQAFKNLEKFCNGPLIQNACVVLVNSTFEENDAEIKLSVPEIEINFDYNAMLEVFPAVLVHFVEWFTTTLISLQEEAVLQCWNQILDNTKKFYQKAFHHFTKEKLSRDTLDAEFAEMNSCKPLNWIELRQLIKLCNEKLTEECEDFWDKNAVEDVGCKSFKEKQAKFMSQARTYMKRSEKEFFHQLFGLSTSKNFDRKTSCLAIALKIYQKFSQKLPASSRFKMPYCTEEILNGITRHTDSGVQAAFYEYLSLLIEKSSIIPVRARGNCSGWYDARKHLIYLPHATYYDDFKQWYEKEKCPLTLSKRALQDLLYQSGVLIARDNGTKYRYLRSDFQLVVTAVDVTKAKTTSVVKVKYDAALLSTSARDRLAELSSQHTLRRSKNS